MALCARCAKTLPLCIFFSLTRSVLMFLQRFCIVDRVLLLWCLPYSTRLTALVPPLSPSAQLEWFLEWMPNIGFSSAMAQASWPAFGTACLALFGLGVLWLVVHAVVLLVVNRKWKGALAWYVAVVGLVVALKYAAGPELHFHMHHAVFGAALIPLGRFEAVRSQVLLGIALGFAVEGTSLWNWQGPLENRYSGSYAAGGLRVTLARHNSTLTYACAPLPVADPDARPSWSVFLNDLDVVTVPNAREGNATGAKVQWHGTGGGYRVCVGVGYPGTSHNFMRAMNFGPNAGVLWTDFAHFTVDNGDSLRRLRPLLTMGTQGGP